MMHADIGMLEALSHGKPEAEPPRRKVAKKYRMFGVGRKETAADRAFFEPPILCPTRGIWLGNADSGKRSKCHLK